MIKALFALALLTAFSCVVAAELVGRVVGVSDGDTLTLLVGEQDSYKVRLSGIDAPEKNQLYGMVSKKHLSDQVLGKTVSVLWEKQDKYGRVVGRVMVNDEDVCLAQIRSGMAWHYKAYATEQPQALRQSYSEAELEARSKRVGLWQDPHPIAPWDFRHPERKPNRQ